MTLRFRDLFLFLGLLFLIISGCGKKDVPTLKGYQQPAPVKNLLVEQRRDYVFLEWSYPEDKKTGFVIERKVDEEDFEKISTQPGKAYTEPIEYGETYTYKVMARSGTGILSNATGITITALEPPPPPASISFSIQMDKVKLSWEYESKNVFFNVYKANGKTTLLTAQPIQEHSYEIPAEPNTTVSYEVRTLLGGPFMYEGEGTRVTIASQDFMPSKPSGLTAVRIEGGVRLIWAENPESWVRAYVIYKEINGELQKIGQSMIPTYLDPDTKGGIYRIAALGPVLESQLSDPVSVPLSK